MPKKKTGADDPSRAFGGGADNVAFSDIRHIRPDTEDMLEYVLGLRPATEIAPGTQAFSCTTSVCGARRVRTRHRISGRVATPTARTRERARRRVNGQQKRSPVW